MQSSLKFYFLESVWDLDICALFFFGPGNSRSSFSEAFEVVWRTVKNFTRLNTSHISRLIPKGLMMTVSVSKVLVNLLIE